MAKKILIVCILIVLAILVYPKAYDESGGFMPRPYANDKKCLGVSYSLEPKQCDDCFTVKYCIGIPISRLSDEKTETTSENITPYTIVVHLNQIFGLNPNWVALVEENGMKITYVDEDYSNCLDLCIPVSTYQVDLPSFGTKDIKSSDGIKQDVFNTTIYFVDQGLFVTQKGSNKRPISIEKHNSGDIFQGAVNQTFKDYMYVSGLEPPYQWKISDGNLPPGISLKPEIIVPGNNCAPDFKLCQEMQPFSDPLQINLAGVPSQSGVYQFEISVTDALGNTATKKFTIRINE